MTKGNPYAPLFLLAHVAEGEFFAADELAKAEAIEKEHARLVKQFDAHSNRAARDQIMALRAAHRANPTDETFQAMKSAEMNKDALDTNIRALRQEAKFSRDHFIQKTYRPFFIGIFSRLFVAAGEWLKMRRELETETADSLGLEPQGDGGVIAAVESALREVQTWLHDPGPGTAFRMAGNPLVALVEAKRSHSLTQMRLAELYAQGRAELEATAEAERARLSAAAIAESGAASSIATT